MDTHLFHAKKGDLWRLLIAARMASIAGWPICLAGSTNWAIDGRSESQITTWAGTMSL